MRRKIRLIKAGEEMPLSKRIYPMETLRAAHRRANLDQLMVYVRHPPVGLDPEMAELAGKVERLYFEDDTLMAEVMFLRNANGLIGETMCEQGIRWAPAGIGTIDGNTVNADYELLYICPIADQFRENALKEIFRQKARQNRGVKTIQG